MENASLLQSYCFYKFDKVLTFWGKGDVGLGGEGGFKEFINTCNSR